MNAPSTTLRPRNRHRSHEDEDNDLSVASTLLSSSDANFTSSRATSPIPRARPSQASRTQQEPGRSRSNSRFPRASSLLGSQVTPSTFATGLWESSWSSLRGMAADLIGSDSSAASSPRLSPVPKGRILDASHGSRKRNTLSRWGPAVSGDKQLASGTTEDRIAKLQAKKRETLLMANGHTTPDSSGRYKRRDSDNGDCSSVPPEENEERDALVYVHIVKPADTLPGVMIKYNCQPNVFRRANRLWPNDSIQVRKIVVLPVDACGVRGRKVLDSELASYNLPRNQNKAVIPSPKQIQTPWGDSQYTPERKEAPSSSSPASPSVLSSLSISEEPPWKHDSWIIIDGFSEPIEIARLSRRALGYFPRSRRKSHSISDLGTPSPSIEFSRSSCVSSSPRPTTRSRSGSNSYFANHLQGPGGVGTMSKNVRNPGPANDGLNKLFPTLQPAVAPCSSSESQISNSLHNNSFEDVGVGVTIETWVRRFASKASASLQPATTGGTSGIGDLIELSEDAFELAEDYGHRGNGRMRQNTGEPGTDARDGH